MEIKFNDSNCQIDTNGVELENIFGYGDLPLCKVESSLDGIFVIGYLSEFKSGSAFVVEPVIYLINEGNPHEARLSGVYSFCIVGNVSLVAPANKSETDRYHGIIRKFNGGK